MHLIERKIWESCYFNNGHEKVIRNHPDVKINQHFSVYSWFNLGTECKKCVRLYSNQSDVNSFFVCLEKSDWLVGRRYSSNYCAHGTISINKPLGVPFETVKYSLSCAYCGIFSSSLQCRILRPAIISQFKINSYKSMKLYTDC